MRTDSALFLLAGFVVGFGLLYAWTSRRAPEVVQAMPPLLQLPQQGQRTGPPPTPPLDTARLEELQRRVEANPQDFEALVGLGNIHYEQRNWAEAANFYNRALAIRSDVNVRTDLGTAYFYLDRYEDALREFNKNLETNPGHAQSMFNIGIVLLYGQNDPDGAVRIWEQLIEMNPNFPQIDLVREQIRAAQEAQRQ